VGDWLALKLKDVKNAENQSVALTVVMTLCAQMACVMPMSLGNAEALI
jgi:hypothetical protein